LSGDRFAISEACAIVGARAEKFRDLRLHFAPGNIGVAEARVENNGRIANAYAVDVHLVSADMHENSRPVIKAAVAGLGDVFVEKAGGSQQNDEQKDSVDDSANQRTRGR
jgi:hypothetical protein